MAEPEAKPVDDSPKPYFVASHELAESLVTLSIGEWAAKIQAALVAAHRTGYRQRRYEAKDAADSLWIAS